MFSSGKLCRAAAVWILVSIASATTAYARQSTLPSPWVARDIGAPAIPGSTVFNAPAGFTLTAAAEDIWGTSDQFRFVYVAVPGNVDVRARVTAIDASSTWSKGGVMIRASLSSAAAHASAFVSSANGLAFQRRPAYGGLSLHTTGELAGPPRWVRLVRIGSLVTSYSSVDGVTWTKIGSETIQLGSTAYVGIAATSHNAAAPATFTASQ